MVSILKGDKQIADIQQEKNPNWKGFKLKMF